MMGTKDAINQLKDFIILYREQHGWDVKTIKALEMAIEALEQEPCDKYIKEIDHLRKYISKLETQIVEQEPKTVLYSGDGYADGYMVYDMAECPNCGYEYEEGDKDWGLPFCPNCGQSLNWESEVEE